MNAIKEGEPAPQSTPVRNSLAAGVESDAPGAVVIAALSWRISSFF